MSLAKLCETLDIKYEINNMFTKIPYNNIEEVLRDVK